MFPFLAPVPFDVGQTAGVALRAEERVRAGNDVNAAETELNPQARYDVIWRGGQDHGVLLLSPRLLGTYVSKVPTIDPAIVNPESINRENLERPNKEPFSALMNGGFGVELNRPRYRITAYQFAAYGSITTTALLVTQPWGGEGRPADPNPILPSTTGARMTLLFAQTQIGVPIRITKRVAITPSFDYNAFGGADDQSRGVIALTEGPGAGIRLDVAASRFDRFETNFGAGRILATFQGDRTGPVIYRGVATQSYRRWLTRNTSWQIGGGATMGGDEINGYTLYSLADTALLYDTWGVPNIPPGAAPYGAFGGRGVRTQVGLVGKVEPWLDLFSGELEQRGTGIAAANVTLDRTTLRAQVAAAQVFGTPQSVAKYATVQAESSVRYRFTRIFSMELGARFGYQDFSNAVRFNTLRQGMVFFGLSYTPLPGRF